MFILDFDEVICYFDAVLLIEECHERATICRYAERRAMLRAMQRE